MPIIVFANPKGGAGKSTSAVILATQLAAKGAGVTIIDGDVNKPVTQWAAQSAKRNALPPNITVIADATESTIIDTIEEAAQQTPFVIVDLEGTASHLVSYSVSRADLVIIPIQGSQLDAAQAGKAVGLIKQQEKAFKRSIPFAILFTRTNPALKPRTLLHIQEEFRKHNIRAFQTQLHEREAYRAIFSFGGALETLEPSQVGNLDKAIANARAYAAEVISTFDAVEAPAERRAGVA